MWESWCSYSSRLESSVTEITASTYTFSKVLRDNNIIWPSSRSYQQTYLWTSTSPRCFVIAQVVPRLPSRDGCETSRPCFLTSSMYLQCQATHLLHSKCLHISHSHWEGNRVNQVVYGSICDSTSPHWNASNQDPHPKWRCTHTAPLGRGAKSAWQTTCTSPQIQKSQSQEKRPKPEVTKRSNAQPDIRISHYKHTHEKIILTYI